MEAPEVENLSEYCRVCLKPPEESEVLDINMIYDEEDNLTYYECFSICTQQDLLEGDGLPQNLCRACGIELQMAYDFHKKVENSKQVLEQIRNQHQQQIVEYEQESTKPAAEQTPLEEHEMDVEQFDETVECEELEEHLVDTDQYQTEELDEDDAETIHYSITANIYGDEYEIETITLNKEDGVEQNSNKKGNSQMPWQRAVESVANESHLPLTTTTTTPTTTTTTTTIKKQRKMETSICREKEFIGIDESSTNTVETEDQEHQKESIVPDELPSERKRYKGQYSCDVCHKIFQNHSRMLLHRRSHEPDRPKYPCTQCGRIYATKQAMAVHERTVHKKCGYACKICNKIYAIKKSLEVHMRYHTGDFPFVCNLCGKKFAQLSHLTTHNNVQHNRVRFICNHPECGKFFTSSASLRNHEFSHSDMPFECAYCQKGYPAKAKLKVHIRRKHNKELTLDQLENMRKFHVTRSKLNVVRVLPSEDYIE